MSTQAERAVACKHWEWMPGMLTTRGHRVIALRRFEPPMACAATGHIKWDGALELPDFTDPVTAAALLPMVRKAYGDDDASCRRYWLGRRAAWRVVGMLGDWLGDSCETEIDALLSALEAAP